tara:strand:+ start:959 stop:1939 length:981 start_codon:yes stop_codon:yes gene_type:complete
MPISCRVTRGELTESIHVAFAVAVDNNGQILYSTGDPGFLTCIRSSFKPFQAAACVKKGAVDIANFNDKELALMCASHKGEDIHIDIAKSMLDKLGLSVKDYECGSHFPSDANTRNKLIRKDQKPSSIYNNCSGKHAGMLALAKYFGEDVRNYINKSHPVQITILNYLEELINEKNVPFEIDGCSAPVPFLTLETIAKLFQLLGRGERPELERVFNAMTSHPDLIGGTNHFDSVFTKVLRGRGLTKVGAESVRGISLKIEDDKAIGIAIKILDGNFRALQVATMKLLEHLNLLKEDELKELNQYKLEKLKNHNGLETGRIEAYIDY